MTAMISTATPSASPASPPSSASANPEAFRLPVPLVWQVDFRTLSRRQYLKDIDYLREHTRADLLQLAPVEGVMPEDADQFHDPVKELVEYARSRGFRVILRTSPGLKGVMPRMDVLVVFGEFAHFNWLPDGEAARSQWDVNGSQHVMAKAESSMARRPSLTSSSTECDTPVTTRASLPCAMAESSLRPPVANFMSPSSRK